MVTMPGADPSCGCPPPAAEPEGPLPFLGLDELELELPSSLPLEPGSYPDDLDLRERRDPLDRSSPLKLKTSGSSGETEAFLSLLVGEGEGTKSPFSPNRNKES